MQMAGAETGARALGYALDGHPPKWRAPIFPEPPPIVMATSKDSLPKTNSISLVAVR